MREIRTSGLMSGEGKRSVAAWPKPPRPSSTLLRSQKNDAADAAGICEAVTRPSMRFTGVRAGEPGGAHASQGARNAGGATHATHQGASRAYGRDWGHRGAGAQKRPRIGGG